MSLAQILMLPPMLGDSAVAEVVRIRWSTSVNAGTAEVAGETVDFDATDAEMESALETGLSLGVSVVKTTAGGYVVYTVTFDDTGNQSDITCDFSGLRVTPTINLDTQTQGVAAAQASVTVTASGNDDVTTDTIGNSVTLDSGGAYASSAAATGWTAGSPSGESVTFTKDDAGFFDLSTYAVASGAGSVNPDSEGADAVNEVQRLWFSPDAVGGTWKTNFGASFAQTFDITAGDLKTAIENDYPDESIDSVTGGGTAADKWIITFSVSMGAVADDYLSPTNVDLDAGGADGSVTVLTPGS